MDKCKGALGPVGQMLQAYAREGIVRLHMPGHKGRGPALDPAWDVTEVPGTDDLHAAEGPLLEAQRALARVAGAHQSYFIVGGSTCGVHAMLLAALPPGGSFLATRHVHRSVVNACILYGFHPIWVEVPEVDGLPVAPEAALCQALEAHPEANAILVTRPDYYGRCLDLCPLSRAAHAKGMRLLVDAAHGAHLAMGEGLPGNPAGFADLWVESAHKTLPALTQAAWLHAGPGAPEQALSRALDWVETSSPSYLLMQSLDEARLYLEQARPRLCLLLAGLERLRESVDRLPGLEACGQAWAKQFGYAAQDPTRVVVDVRGTGRSGLAAAAGLRQGGVQVEMADFYRVVAITTPEDRWEDLAGFGRALAALSEHPGPGCPPSPALPTPGPACLPLAQAARGRSRRIPLREAAGEVAAEAVGAYPPGEPCWLPGEVITPEALAYLDEVVAQGGSLFGARKGMVEVVDAISIHMV